MPRFSISGQTLLAPKLLNSHHLRPGLAFTGPRKHLQPLTITPATSTANTTAANEKRGRRRASVTERSIVKVGESLTPSMTQPIRGPAQEQETARHDAADGLRPAAPNRTRDITSRIAAALGGWYFSDDGAI